ncbi:MAG: hypothetical protein WB580_06090 [Candidatus Binataceae bacterium]
MARPKSSAAPAARRHSLGCYHLLWDHDLAELALRAGGVISWPGRID